jgi:hypothetical protein
MSTFLIKQIKRHVTINVQDFHSPLQSIGQDLVDMYSHLQGKTNEHLLTEELKSKVSPEV